MFYFVSIGLGDEKDITVRGLEIVKKCKRVYLESYTAILCDTNIETLEKYYERSIIIADRKQVEENSDTILKDANIYDICILVVGDAFAATTHHDLYLRAIESNITVKVINNASIINAISCCGLQLYTFGQTISIPYFDNEWRPTSWYEKLAKNYNMNLHTLCLLDIKVKEQSKDNIAKNIPIYEKSKFMTISEAIEQIYEAENIHNLGICTDDTWCIGVSRVGHSTQQIISGTLYDLKYIDFGKPLHSLVICAPNLHDIEERMFFHYHWNKDKKKLEQEYLQMKEQRRLDEISKRRIKNIIKVSTDDETTSTTTTSSTLSQ